MTTITLEHKAIEKKYSPYELKMKFISFLERELKEDSLELYEISINEAPKEVFEAYKNIDNMNFIKR